MRVIETFPVKTEMLDGIRIPMSDGIELEARIWPCPRTWCSFRRGVRSQWNPAPPPSLKRKSTPWAVPVCQLSVIGMGWPEFNLCGDSNCCLVSARRRADAQPVQCSKRTLSLATRVVLQAQYL